MLHRGVRDLRSARPSTRGLLARHLRTVAWLPLRTSPPPRQSRHSSGSPTPLTRASVSQRPDVQHVSSANDYEVPVDRWTQHKIARETGGRPETETGSGVERIKAGLACGDKDYVVNHGRRGESGFRRRVHRRNWGGSCPSIPPPKDRATNVGPRSTVVRTQATGLYSIAIPLATRT